MLLSNIGRAWPGSPWSIYSLPSRYPCINAGRLLDRKYERRRGGHKNRTVSQGGGIRHTRYEPIESSNRAHLLIPYKSTSSSSTTVGLAVQNQDHDTQRLLDGSNSLILQDILIANCTDAPREKI